MQQAEEAHAETKPQSGRGLRLIHERSIVEFELVERLTQRRVVRPVNRVEPGEHHRLGVAIATQRILRRFARVGHRVTNARLAHVLHPGDEVADLADAETVGRDRLG